MSECWPCRWPQRQGSFFASLEEGPLPFYCSIDRLIAGRTAGGLVLQSGRALRPQKFLPLAGAKNEASLTSAQPPVRILT
jgi:hypothetical protein